MAVGNRLRSAARDERMTRATLGSNFAMKPAICFAGEAVVADRGLFFTTASVRCETRRHEFAWISSPQRLLVAILFENARVNRTARPSCTSISAEYSSRCKGHETQSGRDR